MTEEERKLTIEYLEEMKEKYIEGEGYERHPLPEWYALDKAIEALEQDSIFDKIKAEVEEQEKWLAEAGYNAYNVDIAFESVKRALKK